MRQLIVQKNDAGQRVDKFLTKTLVNLPKSLMYKFLRTKHIKLNGKRCEANVILNENDVFTLFISDEFFPVKEIDSVSKYARKDLDLSTEDIAYEDENILIIDKKAGITVHPNTEDETPSKNGNEIYLVDMMIGYLYKKKEYVPENENSFCPALCNRLDRNTAGLVIAAKNAESLRIMNQKIKDRELKKLYYCEADGIFEKKSATISDFLYKDKKSNRVYIFKSKQEAKKAMRIKYDDDIKTVITKYSIKGEKDGKSLVLVDLITGRTHQIRAHLAYYGHPLIGDGKYGKAHSKNKNELMQHLYSYSVEFKFETESGVLSYLNGKTVCGRPQEFMKKYPAFS